VFYALSGFLLRGKFCRLGLRKTFTYADQGDARLSAELAAKNVSWSKVSGRRTSLLKRWLTPRFRTIRVYPKDLRVLPGILSLR
jgi:hypothetical protein